MGNSQSVDNFCHAVDEGINIYKKVIKEQEQQGHQQYSTTTNSYSNDDDQYSQLRAKAGEQARLRNKYFAESQEAYRDNRRAEAKILSNKGHIHAKSMKVYNQEAADHIFFIKNKGRPDNEIDLHGLYVTEASAKVEEAIQRCKAAKYENLTIIVGKGLHSPDKIAKLKPAIISLVNKYEVNCQPNIPNPGCLYIEFNKGTGDLSWLDELFNGRCMIM